MSGQRWARLLAVPIALIALGALVAGLSRLQPSVVAGERASTPVAGACRGPVPIGSAAAAHGSSTSATSGRGTWWRLVDRLDQNGLLTGRQLVAGIPARTTLTMNLGTESMARGPVGGLVVVTTDDGTASEIRIVSIAGACSWLVHRDANVARSAIVDPRGGSVYVHLVERSTRTDLGVFRVDGDGPASTLTSILAPLAPQPDLGPIWATELRLSGAGDALATQSCSDRGCLTRVVSLTVPSRPVVEIAGQGQGPIIGFTGAGIATWAFCDGLPCPVQAWTTGGHAATMLADAAVGAGLTADGRYLLVVTDGGAGRAVRVDLVTGTAVVVRGVAGGELPLGAFVTSTIGLEVGPDEIGLVANGGDPRAFAPGEAAVLP
jgi:hypothetical protein